MPMTKVRMSGGTHTAPNFRRLRVSAMKATAAMAAHSATPGAARRRLSGAHRRTSSTAIVLLRIKNGDELAFADCLAFADLDLLDDARLGREHGDFHLHRFEDHDLALGLDPVAGLGLDLPDVAGDFRLNVDDGHTLVFSPALPTRPPSRYAASFTAERTPLVRVERPSPILADSAATVAPAIPALLRRGRPAAPARSAPKPASL